MPFSILDILKTCTYVLGLGTDILLLLCLRLRGQASSATRSFTPSLPTQLKQRPTQQGGCARCSRQQQTYSW